MAKTLVLWILLASSLITGILTIFSFYYDYTVELKDLKLTFVQIESSYLKSISLAAWNMDKGQIERQLQGIINFRDVTKAEVSELSGKTFTKEKHNSSQRDNHQITKYFDLVVNKEKVGVLQIVITKLNMYDRLISKALVFFVTQGVKTISISFVIFLIFQYLVSRHIIKITSSLKNSDATALEKNVISLDRKTKNDELSFLVNKINTFIEQVSHHNSEHRDQIVLQKQKALYSAKMASIGKIANGVAHEINNPLAIIYGFNTRLSRYLADKNHLDKEAKRMLEKSSEMVDRIAAIIRSLRFISQDASDKGYEIINNQEIIDQTKDLCQEQFKAKGISLTVTSKDVTEFPCRGAQISQILLSLLYNSIDALTGIKQPWVKLDTDVIEGFIEFSVTDNGIGIPEELRHRIFEPFFSTKPIGKGSGLSLSVSKGIAEGHKGHFFYDNESEHTRFVLRLPLPGFRKQEVDLRKIVI